jgi:APA family basic amino acid/polyamine antiporter
MVVIAIVGLVNIALLYRRITSIATITIALWIGTIAATLVVIATGAMHFSSAVAFDLPPAAVTASPAFLFGLGAATRIGIYDYLGYYNVCYIGDEVANPGRVIPRSIVISTVAVAAIYFAINLSIIGVVSWREFVPAGDHAQSAFVVSVFMERIYGSAIARGFTVLILWTAFASVFALLLGYSRIPFAAAREGYFFKVFGAVHPTGGFPHVSLVCLGVLSIVASAASLGVVIDALIAIRILVQFIGQIVGLILLRRARPEMPRPYRMWLYPVPAAIAFAGWVFVLATTDPSVILFGLVALAAGIVCFLAWARHTKEWPFATRA